MHKFNKVQHFGFQDFRFSEMASRAQPSSARYLSIVDNLSVDR